MAATINAIATNNRKLEMEAKHDLELERIKNERELQVGKNAFNVLMLFQCFHAIANATLVSKHPSTIMIEQHATNSKKLEMEAKHDLELERIKNKRELQVVNNDQKEKHES